MTSNRHRLWALLPWIVILVAVTGIVIATVAMSYVENRLVQTTGEGLAVAATDMVNGIDRMVHEWYVQLDSIVQLQAEKLSGLDVNGHMLNTFQQTITGAVWLART